MTFKSGLNPVSKLGYGDTGQIGRYRIKNNDNISFFSGQPVQVSAGFLDVATNTGTPIGVFDSAVWIDGVTLRPVRSKFVPSGTSSAGGNVDGQNPAITGIVAYVYDDPNQEFVIQADTSVAASFQGGFAQVTAAGTGSTVTGRSNARLDVSAVGTSSANAMFKIIDAPNFVNQVGGGVSAGQTSSGALENDWDSPRTFVSVIFAKHYLQRA